ncbi:hypothetical protein TWF569_002964 [Orbilia oligospora]|uniref:Uncharacterized protein n=1 Tax=Orbilia oligospora TaxID=2813651 RepID=A0A7C8NVW0_ORBOL|nr:hypothetical protein TWF706_007408 [Orbilia oligospora]KAF3111442.1 hypothetical protein TWF102_007106 [Orbilia oligospora]KAF3117268.1 hypothetical protein TWF103_007410 [Orbilia oligospora]KAF3140795.1 hypothetical protein TWF594_006293 [Orbilia oligospora]KAF3152661.1 hypothetical protein TWF569_002964 [Orbilia oligospora]
MVRTQGNSPKEDTQRSHSTSILTGLSYKPMDMKQSKFCGCLYLLAVQHMLGDTAARCRIFSRWLPFQATRNSSASSIVNIPAKAPKNDDTLIVLFNQEAGKENLYK